MINNILAVGDSFTYGEELESTDSCFANQLAKILKAHVLNLGKPGSGNKLMIRNVIEHVSIGKPLDLVIIGWSSPGRMEFADDDGTFDIWPGRNGQTFIGQQPWRIELIDYINKYHSPEHIYQSHMLDVILMQTYLKNNDIKYIMMTTQANEYYHNIYCPRMQHLVSQIDTKYYIGWPYEGMAEWTQGCKRGPYGHFLEDGHKQVTKKLYEHIRNFGWLS